MTCSVRGKVRITSPGTVPARPSVPNSDQLCNATAGPAALNWGIVASLPRFPLFARPECAIFFVRPGLRF
jgi:hypothetical protein